MIKLEGTSINLPNIIARDANINLIMGKERKKVFCLNKGDNFEIRHEFCMVLIIKGIFKFDGATTTY